MQRAESTIEKLNIIGDGEVFVDYLYFLLFIRKRNVEKVIGISSGTAVHQ